MIKYEDFIKKLFKTKYKSNEFHILLSQLTVANLSTIYGSLYGKATKLKKQELVDFFDKNYTDNLMEVLKNLNSEILDYFFYIVENDGELEFIHLSFSFATLMKMTLLAFPVIKDNEYKLVMADKVYDIANIINYDEIYGAVKENDIIVTYVRKLVEIYGEFNINVLFTYLKEYENIQCSYEDKVFFLNYDSIFSNQYEIKNDKIISYDIEEIENYDELKIKNIHLSYYKIPKKEFVDNYYTDAEEEIIYFLRNNLHMEKDMAFDFVEALTKMIKLEANLPQLLKTITLQLNKYEKTQLIKHIEYLYKNTRLYTLKGFTRSEVNHVSKLIPFKPNITKK